MMKNLNVIMMGLKEMEALLMMPLLGPHLLKHGKNDDAEEEGQLGLQSCFRCIPPKCIFADETEAILKEHLKKKHDHRNDYSK